MNRTFFPFIVAFLAASSLTACKDSPPTLTDEQVLTLFGERHAFSENHAPLTISNHIEECVSILSGINTDIYKDMPTEMLGVMKTSCRQDFQKTLSDPDRNLFGLTLKHLEDPKLAEQIVHVREQAREQAEAIRKGEEEKRVLEKRTSDEKLIADAQARANALLSSLDERLERINTLCIELEGAKATFEKQKSHAPLLYTKPDACWDSYADNLRDRAKDVVRHLAELQLDPASAQEPAIPDFGIADPKRLDSDQADVEKVIQDLKKEIEAE
ncbi:MAG: hypothetical protein JSC085_000318 [Candidatus Tokpelaia sp. JSC085]|nr:MAG: hypothetical protein JSC085_000318 [Candidatus Tokpelaia sp. JSC085]